MLWLKSSESIVNIPKTKYVKILKKRGFNIVKILQYSKYSLVGLTENSTVVKIINPLLSKYQLSNLLRAIILFNNQKIKVPKIIKIDNSTGFCIIESEFINSELFSHKKTIEDKDLLFLEIFNKLNKKHSYRYGPINTQSFSIEIFNKSHYLNYWNNQFEHFINKISIKTSFIDKAKTIYEILIKKLKSPKIFILSHSDISPKHIFINRGKIGCIDLEDSMYLDPAFMWGLWFVRTFNNRNSKNREDFLIKFTPKYLDKDWLNFHIFRELFIQYYYRDFLNNFIIDYSEVEKIFRLRTHFQE